MSDLITTRNLIVKCAGGSQMGIQRKTKPAFTSLRRSKMFKDATEEERVILLNTLRAELNHRMEWETMMECL